MTQNTQASGSNNDKKSLLHRIRILRFYAFRFFLSPFQQWARKSRMKRFTEAMALTDGTRVLDLGGQPEIWDTVESRLKIFCVNLPGIAREEYKSHHDIVYLEGDGCDMSEFPDQDFDIVFSNSVIEHVGDIERQQAFASEVARLGKRYWVQTPSKGFPIEAHCGMPLWWFYPEKFRQFMIERWRKDLPKWTEMVETTRVISKRELGRLFPDGQIFTERMIFPKSNIAFRTDPNVD